MKSVTTESETRDSSPYSLDSTLLSFEEDQKPVTERISALHTISAII